MVDAQPTADEKALVDQVAAKMGPGAGHLDALKKYSGCAEQIRKVPKFMHYFLIYINIRPFRVLVDRRKKRPGPPYAQPLPNSRTFSSFRLFSVRLRHIFFVLVSFLLLCIYA